MRLARLLVALFASGLAALIFCRRNFSPSWISNSIHHERQNERRSLAHSLSPAGKYVADNNPKTLNIHVVPHTHDDVGWLKTVEQYFYGDNMTIQHACVNDILDSVVMALLENPSRTFTYVEQKFFSMWWNLQDDPVKDSVRFLVGNKQLSFANGGWCMHDEATSHFIGMIDQTTLGHRFLKRELGVIPRIGWQLDPFGHSASQASYFTSKVGFDALYFGRIDYQDLNRRHYQQDCEGLWNSSRNFDSTVFWGLTGSYEGNYGAPEGYCFDINCDDPYIVEMDNRQLELAIHALLSKIRTQSDRTRGHHVMLTMGSDFQYQRAHVNFANVDLMISTIQELQRLNKVDISTLFGPRFDSLNVFYSSPEYYTKCKNEEFKSSGSASGGWHPSVVNYSMKADDFMPYSDCEHCFWTGYFTSRPGMKKLERVASSFMLSTRQIESIIDNSDKADPFQCRHAFEELEDALGVVQHHDGVSGTSKQHVAYDYAKRIQNGINRVSACTTRKLRHLLFGVNATNNLSDLTYCQLLNETKCSISQSATASGNRDMYVVVYNGLGQIRSTIVHLPISIPASYRIQVVNFTNSDQNFVQRSETIPVIEAWRGKGGAQYRLPFLASHLPALGAHVYKVSKIENEDPPDHSSSTVKLKRSLTQGTGEVIASNEFFAVTFDELTGVLESFKIANRTVAIEQAWGYYTSYDKNFDAPPDNQESDPRAKNNQNSGAYIFRPSQVDQSPHFLKQVSALFYNTSVGLEVHSEFDVPWIKTITRVQTGQPFLEIEYTIGPIPIDDGRGKEVITRLKTPVRNGGVFFTDSNGREFVERQLNHRPTWDLNVYEPIAGNYYPVNAALYIEEQSGLAAAIATDRSQGGTSIKEGNLELMVHRRTVVDDWRGVDEALNETCIGMTPYPPYGNGTRLGDGVVIKGKHYLQIGTSLGAPLARSMMDAAFVEPLVYVGTTLASRNPRFESSRGISGLTEEIPPGVMILTRAMLHEETEKTILLRVGHQYSIGEDKNLSKVAKMNLTAALPGYTITKAVETTLTANQRYDFWLKNRLIWSGSASNITSTSLLAEYEIELHPMDIRTFLVTVR